MNKSRILPALLLPFVAAGCQVSQEAARNTADVRDQASGLLPMAAQPLGAKNVDPVKVSNGVYVGKRAIENVHGDPLPSKFERKDGITISRQEPMTLREIATAITKQTAIPVVLASVPVFESAETQTEDPSVGGLASGPIPEGFPLEQALSSINGAQSIEASGMSVTEEKLPLRFTGKLSNLLDVVTAHYNVAWRHSGGKIVLDQVVSQSFDVPALPVVAELAFSLDAESNSDGETSSATSGQSASTESTTDLWTEINEALESLVGTSDSSGNTYSISKTTGVVNVTADPATVKRVANYLKGINERLSEQIAISVRVYSVALRDSESFDLDVAGLIEKAGKYGIGVGNGVPGGQVPSATDGNAGFGWALLDTDSNWYGSNALVQALSERGDVSTITNASVTTLNGVPVPLQVGQQRDYVKDITVITEDGVTTTEITPSTITAGFGLHLVPRVDRDGDLNLQYGINISELVGSNDGFDNFTTNEQVVQLKRVNQRNFVQQAKIPNNKTLVLAGFEQVRSTNRDRGVGHPLFPLFGGGRSAMMEREIIVIAITPTVLDLGKK
ncbi:secretin N-terminal domain-containing protein [Roseibium sp. RKSG952]|uniref:secretin N-terminal domain-containing protein n=1 Tax=Roseibium sp. RKSG952 TaxID=2529384 RepID=UPI0012BB4DBB|nr:secretin N-terminal domain-containing protein [Roseibium sp. RKSG952]MTH97581.1 hypothetical protein [Roseibium sp. RKSG952]